ncbi:MAG: hypothetical protein OSA98_18670 [Rubripirellula sp.]|nr:hypothetical protein [Rubripirellula sp.]
MEFEDIQVVWNSQHDKPLYCVDEVGLHKILRSKSQRFRRLIYWQRLQTYGSSLLVLMLIAAILLVNYFGLLGKIGSSRALAGWEILALLVATVGWLQFSLSVYFGQKQQKNREQSETQSLLDDLDREIKHTAYQIGTRKNILMGFIPPYVGAGLFMLVVFGVAGVSRWILIPVIGGLILGLIIESRSQRRLVDREMLPRLCELETLREKLTDPHR